MFVSRAEYDKLIDRFPRFMAEDLKHFKRRWGVGGVIMTTSHPGWEHALKANLAVIRSGGK